METNGGMPLKYTLKKQKVRRFFSSKNWHQSLEETLPRCNGRRSHDGTQRGRNEGKRWTFIQTFYLHVLPISTEAKCEITFWSEVTLYLTVCVAYAHCIPSIHTTSVQICSQRWRTIALGWHGADADAQTLTEEEHALVLLWSEMARISLQVWKHLPSKVFLRRCWKEHLDFAHPRLRERVCKFGYKLSGCGLHNASTHRLRINKTFII